MGLFIAQVRRRALWQHEPKLCSCTQGALHFDVTCMTLHYRVSESQSQTGTCNAGVTALVLALKRGK